MTRRLACETCLESDRPTAWSIQLDRRVCPPCQERALASRNRPAPLTALDDPWLSYEEPPNPDDARRGVA